MSATLQSQRYGKCRVRLTTLDRSEERHRLTVASVDVTLYGDFERSYTDDDNSTVVATDSMKNTVYVLARELGVESIESFGRRLGRHFYDQYDQVSRAEIELEEELWSPVVSPSGERRHAFERRASERGLAAVAVDASGEELVSGLDELQLVKTASSGFSDFHRDRFTTLKNTDDRLFATTVQALWSFGDDPDGTDFARVRQRAREAVVEAFATHDSKSVQATLFTMGRAVLDAVAAIEEITLSLPNQHHLLVDLEPFGLDNPNRVFVGTDEPYGIIEATIGR